MGLSVSCVPDAVQRGAQRSGAPLIRDRRRLKRSRVCSASFRYASCCAAPGTRERRDPMRTNLHVWPDPLHCFRPVIYNETATRTCEPSARDIVLARDLHAIFELDDVRARDLLDNGPLERMGPAHG